MKSCIGKVVLMSIDEELFRVSRGAFLRAIKGKREVHPTAKIRVILGPKRYVFAKNELVKIKVSNKLKGSLILRATREVIPDRLEFFSKLNGNPNVLLTNETRM